MYNFLSPDMFPIGPYDIWFNFFQNPVFVHFNLLEFCFYANFTIRECVLLLWMNKMSTIRNNWKFNDTSNTALISALNKRNNAYTML